MQALAIGRVIAALGGLSGDGVQARRLEPECLVGLAVVDELGAQYLAGAQAFAIRLQCFVDDAETVALAQGAVKIDVA